MLLQIKVRPSTMMNLEVQTARRNGAAQPMQWGSRKAVLWCKLLIKLNEGALDIGFLLSGQAVAPHLLTRYFEPIRDSAFGVDFSYDSETVDPKRSCRHSGAPK